MAEVAEEWTVRSTTPVSHRAPNDRMRRSAARSRSGDDAMSIRPRPLATSAPMRKHARSVSLNCRPLRSIQSPRCRREHSRHRQTCLHSMYTSHEECHPLGQAVSEWPPAVLREVLSSNQSVQREVVGLTKVLLFAILLAGQLSCRGVHLRTSYGLSAGHLPCAACVSGPIRRRRRG